MSGPWVTVGAWVGHAAAGGGLLLLLAWFLMRRTRQPARQQRLGELGLAAALLLAVLGLGPAWLVVAVPVEETPAAPPPRTETPTPPAAAPAAADPLPDWPAPGPAVGAVPPAGVFEGVGTADRAAADPAGPGPSPAADLPRTAEDEPRPAADPPAPAATAAWLVKAPGPLPTILTRVLAGLGLGYVVLASVLALRWLLGHVVLWRLLAGARPAPEPAARLFAALAPGRRAPRLLVSRRLRVPVSCGLWRPTVLLPEALCEDPAPLRWVFAHELTHLERHDPWTCLLFGLGQVVYFYLPWFWWVRRQVGLCQEFVADAAVAHGEEAPEEYAQFLLGLTRAPAVPAGASSVAGRPSDLGRRIRMLLQAPSAPERRCPWLWSWTAAAGLAALAVPAAGIRLEATLAPAPAVAAPPVSAPEHTPRPEPVHSRESAPAESPQIRQGAPPVPRPESDPPPPPRPEARNAPVIPPFVPGAPARWPEADRLGVRVLPPEAALVDQLDLPRGEGLVVADVLVDSPAARVGLRVHDVLLRVAGKPVPGEPWRFPFLLDTIPGEQRVAVEVVRRGRRVTLGGLILPGVRSPGEPRARHLTAPAPPPGPAAAVTSLVRTGDRFTARQEEGALVIEVAGTVAAGGWRVDEVLLRVGGSVSKFARVDQVPPPFRDRVLRLLAASAVGGGRVEIHPS
jgi:beta-lactamase regulating signal transducer with metallopeptidase domain